MAVLKTKDIRKMSDKEKAEKLKGLKMELVKANVTANKTNAKTKEIKKAISRLITLSNLKKLEDSRAKLSIINSSSKEKVLKNK